MTVIETLIQQSDPANLGLLAVVWWRLDRRLRQLRQQIDGADDVTGSP